MRISAISNEIKSFRLGYTQERPYPWKWTTPVVLCAFLFISPFLALVNVPLSAYNIIQEFTYHPNDTLPAVFLANIVPSVLQNPTDSFTPQLLNYTIDEAFDGVNPVSAFPYYNNPLSDSCDVANIVVQLVLHDLPDVGWSFAQVQFGVMIGGWPEGNDEGFVRATPAWIAHDFLDIFDLDSWSGLHSPDPGIGNFTQASFDVTVHPCCNCKEVLAGGPLERGASLLKSPCSSNPAQNFPYPTSVSLPTQIAGLLAGSSLGNVSISALGTVYGNLIQTLYHLVRLDLGVILENQIYNSPEIFNRTIKPLDKRGNGDDSWTNEARGWH
ncbi:hypothetical protein MSAN_01970000 [Mycena sanguinolenta]|uniref:Uncharacterized protein n=1 Tax=Mycena sanguinolenta TaxID=230812 RepID=A0A8H6XMU4_9AGAR|nr:hypothetical protein MSAN_01970000 [Mycena sanguinolenta]